MSGALTTEQFAAVLPVKMRKKVNQELIDNINAKLTDPILAEEMRNNILGYVNVLQDGRFKITDYINAVRYCSYKLMGDTNISAYIKTFPDRYQHWVDTGISEKDMSSYVSIFNKGKLVCAVMEQSLVPTHILNQDLYQKALNTQVELMTSATSEHVRMSAADSVLNHTKQPDKAKVEMNIGITDTGGALADLRAATKNLVDVQRAALNSGQSSVLDIAHSKIIQGEAEIVDD